MAFSWRGRLSTYTSFYLCQSPFYRKYILFKNNRISYNSSKQKERVLSLKQDISEVSESRKKRDMSQLTKDIKKKNKTLTSPSWRHFQSKCEFSLESPRDAFTQKSAYPHSCSYHQRKQKYRAIYWCNSLKNCTHKETNHTHTQHGTIEAFILIPTVL